MLTEEQLVKQITNTIGKLKVVELSKLLRAQNFSIHQLIDLTLHDDKNIAFRAAWLLENIFLANALAYTDDVAYIIQQIKAVNNPSCKRHYAKILMHITSSRAPKAIKDELATIDLDPVIEQLFDWLIDPKVKIAVKVFAAEALFNLRQRYPWIAEELTNQLQYLMRNGSAGIQSAGKRLLKGLDK